MADAGEGDRGGAATAAGGPERPLDLLDHFFRREHGRLVAGLTRRLGAGGLDLAEEAVQEAMARAVRSWPLAGAPADPAGWLQAHGAQIDAVVTGGHTGISRAMLEQLPRLQVVAVNGVGTDAVDLAYCRSRGASAAASFAARWAGKEAVLKAFGTGLRQGQLRELEILPDELGCPQLRLWGYFAELARQRGIDSMLISLSHAREYAIAQCILGRNSDVDSNRLGNAGN